MIPFGLKRRLRRGINLTIYPTLRCNYDCHYCSQKTYNGEEPPSDNELPLYRWLDIINHFPMRIQQVHYTGGEPFLRPDMLPLVNYLADKNIFVIIYTNMSIYRSFPCNKRVRFAATYHHFAPKERFLKNLEKYRTDGHIVRVEEIGWHSNLPEIKTYLKPYEPLQNGTGGMTNRWLLTPDGMLFYDQLSMHRYLNSRYNPDGYLNGTSYRDRFTERKAKWNA